jgi:translation initiation factor IF-3
MPGNPSPKGKRPQFKRNKNYIRKNDRIRCREVRVIGPSGKMIGVMDPKEALKLAQSAGLDLVEISPNAKPPVCRILDFGKYKYELSKKKKESAKKSSASKLKEIKFRVSTGKHDYETKLRHAEQFLAHGHKVKLTVTFRGREMAHQNLGRDMIASAIEDLKTMGTGEKGAKLMGRKMSTLVIPLPKGKQQLKFSKEIVEDVDEIDHHDDEEEDDDEDEELHDGEHNPEEGEGEHD